MQYSISYNLHVILPQLMVKNKDITCMEINAKRHELPFKKFSWKNRQASSWSSSTDRTGAPALYEN